ncbi:MAG TPA: hypothetical protein VK501_01370 [Baekduia sp.]|uniref:hypothetical protein n=1 Tax=Baekduia sp. TaxID=2600305 RepID=UPI002C663E56|nr:hypothetical protein [Baekduia sp.]HMJ32537.1 hypothetical protein [Baekduia sp.]
MTRSCCPSCRLRFSRATATQLAACPFCAQPLQLVPSASVLGFKLIAVDVLSSDDVAAEQAVALAVALPVPSQEPAPGRRT